MADDDPQITETKLIRLLEKQKADLVVRVIKKHKEIHNEKVFADKIMANLSDLLFVLDEHYQVVKSNHKLRQHLSFQDESLPLHLDNLVDDKIADSIKLALASANLRNFETELLTREGKSVPVSLNGSIMTTDEGRRFYILIATDQSDILDMMSRVKESQEQLLHSSRLASLGEMAAGIGHELTQPLNASLLFARNSIKALAASPPDLAMIENNLNIIVDRINKASSIIKSLKSFAAKAGETSYPVEINGVLANILTFLDSQIKLSEVQVEFSTDHDRLVVLGHEVRLEQVFLNIIQNSIQSMGNVDKPRLAITTSMTKEFAPETLVEKLYTLVAVRDNGHGIPSEIKAKIFDPFFTTREVGMGMGLGLSIVDRIVRGLSGFIKVETPKDGGSEFLVYLPFCNEETKTNETTG